MRKINSFLSNQNIIPKNINQFPFNHCTPRWDNPNQLSFRLFVDSELGNDNNDGLSWSAPLKTLAAVEKIIPFDLCGTHAFIYIHPGIYDAAQFNHTNGFFRLLWGGIAAINEAVGAYGDYCRAGSTHPARSNNQVIIISKSSNMLIFYGDAEYSVDSRNFSKFWSQPGYVCYDRIVFKSDSVSPPVELVGISCKNFSSEGGLTLDLKSCSAIGLSFWSVKSGLIRSLKIIGGTGEASTQSSQYRGAIAAFGVESALSIAPIGMGWHPAFSPPSNKGFELIGIRGIFTTGSSINCKFTFDISDSNTSYSQGSLPDANLPQIYLANNFGGSIFYHSNVCSLNDNSSLPHVVKNYSDSITISFINSLLKQKGNYIVEKLNASAPEDSLLMNNEIAFYLDETNHRLKFKLKYNSGTVKSGEIALT